MAQTFGPVEKSAAGSVAKAALQVMGRESGMGGARGSTRRESGGVFLGFGVIGSLEHWPLPPNRPPTGLSCQGRGHSGSGATRWNPREERILGEFPRGQGQARARITCPLAVTLRTSLSPLPKKRNLRNF